jgi:hypothetical protein
MKTNASIFMICLLTVSAALQASNQTIKGNGNVKTHNITISDYSGLSLVGNMTFEYEQSADAPFLSITVDENIFEYIKAEVKDGILNIGSKSERENGSDNSYNLQPTVYKIKSNSQALKKLNMAGSCNFIVTSPLKIDALNISQAGSGSVELKKDISGAELATNLAGSGEFLALGAVQVTEVSVNVAGSGKLNMNKQVAGEKLKLNLAGSGNITISELNVQALNCNVASSGNIKIGGNARKASYSVAGSGNIKAYECKASQVDASLTGSGNIEAYAISDLKASTIGSGSIAYKGNPSNVEKNTMGSSTIKAVNK